MWPKRLGHKKEDHVFIKLRLVPTLWCKVKTVSAYKPSKFNLYKPSQRILVPMRWLCLNKLKHLLPKLKEYPITSSLDNETKFLGT